MLNPVKRILHPFTASHGVLVPGEQVVVSEEPAGAPLAVTGCGVFNLSFSGEPVGPEVIEAAIRLELRVRAEVVFAGNEAPVTVYAVLLPTLDAAIVLDCYVGTHEYGRWLHDGELDAACQALVLPRARVLYRGPLTAEVLQCEAPRASIRPVVERRHPELGRVIFTHEKENE